MPQQGQSRGNPIQDYVTVAERIEKFYERYPEGRIITNIIEHDAERGFILMRTEVYRHPEDTLPAATGHAYEYRDAGYVQKTSYIEVCETSACGRALALCGFEVKRGIASREELEKSQRAAQREAPPRREPPQREAPQMVREKTPPQVEASPKTNQPATEEQKQAILELLEEVRPGDRRAQQRTLVELTGKDSRDNLTQQEASELITRLRKEASEGSI